MLERSDKKEIKNSFLSILTCNHCWYMDGIEIKVLNHEKGKNYIQKKKKRKNYLNTRLSRMHEVKQLLNNHHHILPIAL